MTNVPQSTLVLKTKVYELFLVITKVCSTCSRYVLIPFTSVCIQLVNAQLWYSLLALCICMVGIVLHTSFKLNMSVLPILTI